MARTATNWQVTLATSDAVVTVATGAAVNTQITEVWLANNNETTARKVVLLAHGAGGVSTANRLLPPMELKAGEGKIIQDTKILLKPGETFRAYQDAGADVTLTAYGVEEV